MWAICGYEATGAAYEPAHSKTILNQSDVERADVASDDHHHDLAFRYASLGQLEGTSIPRPEARGFYAPARIHRSRAPWAGDLHKGVWRGILDTVYGEGIATTFSDQDGSSYGAGRPLPFLVLLSSRVQQTIPFSLRPSPHQLAALAYDAHDGTRLDGLAAAAR